MDIDDEKMDRALFSSSDENIQFQCRRIVRHKDNSQ